MSTPGQNDLSIAILGPGSVGGFLAALFWKKGLSVTCVGREASVEIISQEGIHLESAMFDDFIAHPRAVAWLDVEPDIIFITVKSTGLSEALKRVGPGKTKRSVIVSLLNGLEHMELLRSTYGEKVVAGSIGSVELKRNSSNHIVHSTNSVVVEVAPARGLPADKFEEVVKLISGVGITVRGLKDEKEVLWKKLVRLNAIACTTSASRKMLGFVRSDNYWRGRLLGCIEEAAAVARQEGVVLDPEQVMAQIDSLPAELGSSMQRDIMAGIPSELDSIAGAIVRAGERNGIKCSVIQGLIDKIQSGGQISG